MGARTLRVAAEVSVARLARCAVDVVARLALRYARAAEGAAGALQQLL